MRLFLIGLVALGGCTAESADLRGLEQAIGAAVSLGSASSIAMNEMAAPTVCASITTPCTSYPCNGAVAIQLGSGCPLPLGGTATGTVNVSGSWQSVDGATLGTTFVDAKAGARSVVVVSATSQTVSRSAGKVTVSYVGQNVNVRGASALTAQSSWTVNVDLAGTPGDPSDDTYTITGSNQGTGGSVSQLTASDVVVAPACRLNPISGSATVQHVDTFNIVQAQVRFHPACDGRADVTSTGSTSQVALQFLQ